MCGQGRFVTSELWCEWAWLGGESIVPSVAITVEGDRISRVTPNSEKTRGSVELSGVTLPGLANAHSHAFHRALRGRTQTGEGSFWTWRTEMYRHASRLEPDSYFDLARETYREMVRAGYTVVGEFHYLHHDRNGGPYADPNAMSEALVAAARDAGIRFTLLDALYLHGGLGADRYSPLNEVQARFSDGSAQAWAERVAAFNPSEAVVGAAVHSVRAVDPTSMRVVGEWSRDAEAPVHFHLSEQPAENEQCLGAHGRRPTQVFESEGILGSQSTAVHATHLDPGDIQALGDSGTTICLCPTTERDLADGIGPSRALADHGSPLAIGSDSHAVIDPFEEARAIELNARLSTLRRGVHSPGELMVAASTGGYRSLGWPTGGQITPGALTDLVTVSTDESLDGDTGLGQVLYGGGERSVSHVMVGGEVRFDPYRANHSSKA